jgi:hypothetical protein
MHALSTNKKEKYIGDLSSFKITKLVNELNQEWKSVGI